MVALHQVLAPGPAQRSQAALKKSRSITNCPIFPQLAEFRLPLILAGPGTTLEQYGRPLAGCTFPLAQADFRTRFNVDVLPETSFLVVPKVSSERRDHVSIGWLEPRTIPSDLIFVLQDANLADFAFLTSAMHMAWLCHVVGRLKSDYRYSIGLVYNTFPVPLPSRTELRTYRSWNSLLRLSSTHVPRTPKRHWRTFTTRISCQETYARCTKRWTVRWTDSIVGVDSSPSASESSTCSGCTRKRVFHWMRQAVQGESAAESRY